MSEKIVYRGNDTLFYNSQCLFVEYHDVIAMPWLTILSVIKNSNIYSNILNMSEISNYDIRGLLEWYIYRKHRNIFKSIGVVESIEQLPDEAYDKLLDTVMNVSNDIYRIPTNLNFLSTLRLLLSDSTMIKQIIIYSEKNESMIQETLSPYLAKTGKVKYLCGKFEDVLQHVPDDATYVFSDITKINTLVEYNKLNLSCILIASGLRYNYLESDSSKLKVDLEDLMTKYIFKYSFFDNFDLTNSIGNDLLESEKYDSLTQLDTDE